MTEQQIKSILKAIGVGSSIILGVLIVAAIFLMYKNYLETKKLKLQIIFLQKTIDTPGAVAKPNPMDEGYYSNYKSKYVKQVK